jgi:hypothetical protein
VTFIAEKVRCFYLRRGFEVPEPAQARRLPGESLKNKMTSEAEKVQCFYLRRGFEVPEPIQALGLQARESLKNSMTSEVEKAQCFYLRRGFEVPETIQALRLPGGGVSGKEDGLYSKKV